MGSKADAHTRAPLLPGMLPASQVKRKGSLDLERQGFLEKINMPTQRRSSDLSDSRLPAPPPTAPTTKSSSREESSVLDGQLMWICGGISVFFLMAIALAFSLQEKPYESRTHDVVPLFKATPEDMVQIAETEAANPDSQGQHQSLYIASADLLAWQQLYDQLDGKNWVSCARSREAPCDFNQNGCDSDSYNNARIICTEEPGVGLKITELVMRDNGLKGVFPKKAMETLGPYLHVIDISNGDGKDRGGRTHGLVKNRVVVTENDGTACLKADWCMSELGNRCFFGTHIKVCEHKIRSISTSRRRLMTMAQGELQAWSRLFDRLGGSNWVECSDAKEDPCTQCPGRVICEHQFDQTVRIVSLDLSRIGASSSHLLTGEDFRDLSALRFLNLSHNTLRQSEGPCSVMDFCWSNGAICDFGSSGVEICADAQSEMTEKPLIMPPQDLVAWKSIFDSLNGKQWSSCSNARENPCAACPTRVKCFTSKQTSLSWISSIDLAFIGAKGVLKNAPLQQLSNHGLINFDAHGNDIKLEMCPFTACDHVHSADELEGVHCRFDKEADCPAHIQHKAE